MLFHDNEKGRINKQRDMAYNVAKLFLDNEK